mgnify:FL=1
MMSLYKAQLDFNKVRPRHPDESEPEPEGNEPIDTEEVKRLLKSVSYGVDL